MCEPGCHVCEEFAKDSEFKRWFGMSFDQWYAEVDVKSFFLAIMWMLTPIILFLIWGWST